jgi:hypothetical protein
MYGTVKEVSMAKFFWTKLFSLSSSRFVKKTSSSSLQNSMLSGRWALDYDGTVQGRKVYWANMDNCGCCNESVNLKINVKKKDKTEDDEYILPYII